MLPHLIFKTRWSIRNFTNPVAGSSLPTTFHSFHSALLQLEKKIKITLILFETVVRPRYSDIYLIPLHPYNCGLRCYLSQTWAGSGCGLSSRSLPNWHPKCHDLRHLPLPALSSCFFLHSTLTATIPQAQALVYFHSLSSPTPTADTDDVCVARWSPFHPVQRRMCRLPPSNLMLCVYLMLCRTVRPELNHHLATQDRLIATQREANKPRVSRYILYPHMMQ